ncbi:uncharacterized protein LOC102715501 [Oryza brachyantha]|uniref:Uncharacterized protein n=1 Tax=Oryza brachyantha TaxID=4533 RepID=J3MRW5_ORYBR|nr:uncharacterized protein LOC102715501 [Oryza brachyantha]
MPPRRKRGVAKQRPPEPPAADAPLRERLRWLNDQELEHRSAAIKAIQAAEIESILSRLHLVQSYISKEQQEGCALQYFQENLPNLSVVLNEKQNELELKREDWDSRIIGDHCDEKIFRASVSSLPNVGGVQFSGDSVQKSFMENMAFNFNDFAWDQLPEDQLAGVADALRTPGAVSTRLSFGMTPKTLRLPKKGEMLLSVRGSPLGVYKEENLAAVRESTNGSEDAA